MYIMVLQSLTKSRLRVEIYGLHCALYCNVTVS